MSEKEKLEVVYKNVSEIKPYANNPRLNDHAVYAIANSIQAFGFRKPLVLDKNNVIVCGNTTFKAAKKLGIKRVPCVIAADLTDEQVKEYRIADNSTGELAEWDIDLLKLELADIGADMTDFGLFLDEEGETPGQPPKEADIKKMELRAFEHYDYLVFVFDNQHDFINMAQEFGIERVDAGWTNRKLGIGRVLKGAELLKRIGNADRHTVAEPIGDDDLA